ncbi:hypothetical protein BDN71DRAFT_604415 [Pleurotus eryngii]|uniref:Uncharacterized protein n=1 Tax=Pleurotus eryngii TaxID=5323 RepID=A0A9P5ZGK1_PLEER|nr:hypothetical protein BDN71DRAFT_604415 [Pleurotus eryngii]
MGDAFLGTINGGNNGGRNNVNNSFSMRTDEGASMLNDLRSINDLANGSLANSPLTTSSTVLRSGQSMIGTKPARKTISTYARRFATAIRFRPPRTTERHNGQAVFLWIFIMTYLSTMSCLSRYKCSGHSSSRITVV